MNYLMAGGKQPEPKIGDGCTICMYTDRHAGTIVEVKRFVSGNRKGQIKKVIVQRDTAVRTDENGMSDAQSYQYERDSKGQLYEFRVTKNGSYKGNVGSLLIGSREEYYDYSF